MSVVVGELAEIVRGLEAPRFCLRCRAWFTEMDSMGRRECRYHPGALQNKWTVYGGVLGTFSCCGVAPDGAHRRYAGEDAAIGCRRCDHSDEPGLPPNVTMTVERADVLFAERLAARHVVVDAHTNSLTIVRVE